MQEPQQPKKNNKKQKKADISTSTFLYESRKGHNDSIISVQVNQNDESGQILATSSDDKTIRLWDLRQKGSICMLRDTKFQEEMGNVVFTPQNTLLAASQNTVFGFDLKMNSILIDNSIIQSKSDNDVINCIAIDKTGQYVSAVDDEGDATIFDPYTLEVKSVFSMQHQNMCYTTDFVYTDQEEKNPLCISAGFDCKIILWDLKTKAPIRHHNMVELTKKYLPSGMLNPPIIFSVYGYQNQILCGLESGHVICLNQKDLKKPKYILDGHISKIMRSVFSRFNPDLITNVSSDKTFSIWNQRKRDEFGNPEFLKKVEIKESPNWMETTINNQIIIGDVSKELQIYSIKN